MSALGLVMGGYGRLCRVKDGTRCLCCPYAAVEMSHLKAKFSKYALGSGPRGRWFKSTRPDQIFKNPQETGRVKSRRSLGIAAQIPTIEPSARRFKLRISPKSSRSRQTRSHPSFLAGKHGLKPLGSLLASVTCVLRWTRTSTRYRE